MPAAALACRVTLLRRRAAMLAPMPHERPPRAARAKPLGSFLLRVHEQRVERIVRTWELLDLASGRALRFASLAALQRHLAAVAGGDEAADR